MDLLNEIKKPVLAEIREFEQHFRKNIESPIPLLDVIVNYIIRHKGKQIRPLLVFLSAKTLGEVNKSTFTAATFIELLHTATLIHDDVVDEAFERRNHFSINALWKTKIAVLVGDYFLSRGLLLAVKEKEFTMLETISNAVKEMSEGELLQQQIARKGIIKLENYFEVIDKKTASLIKACTVTGAQSVTTDENMIRKMYQLGYFIGIAFQIKDDIFDYQKKGIIGKPIGNDIKERKFTLPLILALNNTSISQKTHILKLIQIKNKSLRTVEEIIRFVEDMNGIVEAQKFLDDYRQKALNILEELPDNDAKQALIKLVDYIVLRNK